MMTTSIFQDNPGKLQYQNVSTLDFIEAKNDEGGGDNWSCKTCKDPVKSSLLTNQAFLHAGCPSWRPTNSVKSLNGKKYHIPWTAYPKLPGVFHLCVDL